MSADNIFALEVFSTSSFSAELSFGADFITDPSEWSLAGWIYDPAVGPSTHLIDIAFTDLVQSGAEVKSTMSLTAAQVGSLPLDGKTFSAKTKLAFQLDASGPGGSAWRIACGDFIVTP